MEPGLIVYLDCLITVRWWHWLEEYAMFKPAVFPHHNPSDMGDWNLWLA